ncbi:Condensin complex subunit 3 [Fasciola gigantica]|uniref:Condensin complex subunit 3 n=1 Tax=Fasciola gigantica TaxID=46835 RepID=A0A504YZ57_FASGI|nr:Condensin complex subunit 3 [Fasciola gigantica]
MADGSENNTQLEMLEIFRECQTNALSHERLCMQLKSLYDKSRFTHFADEFFELCRYSLVSSERSTYRERTIDFITKFALFCGKSDANDDMSDTLSNRLLLKLFLFCMKYNECPNAAVRFRCMQIIHKLLEGIGDNGMMPDELYSSLQSVLLRRVQDTKSIVRVQAIHALSRMQDPTDADCPAVEAFLWLARHDPTAEVRRAALAAMVLTTRTLPSLVERCRDVSDSVRRTAYKILATRGVLRPLSIAKRIRVLHDGLTDRSAEVRQAAQELVLSWFKATEGDPVQLLRRLDTEGVPETSQLMLDNLFSVLPESDFKTMVQTWATTYLTEERVLKNDCITSESSFFWRALVELLVKRQTIVPASNHSVAQKDKITDSSDADQSSDAFSTDADSNIPLLEMVMPSIVGYITLIKGLISRLVTNVLSEEFDEHTMELECVVVQVLQLASALDLSDEFGRRSLVSLVRDWITSPTVPNTLSPPLLKLHALLEPKLRKRINDVIEMISELCDPVEPPLVSLQTTTMDASNNADLASGVAPTEQNAAPEPVVLSKVDERNIRLKIAKIEVRMNELNESLHNCVLRKDFECATGLRDQCAELEAERSALMRQLHGIGVAQSSGSKDNNGAVSPSVGPENPPKTGRNSPPVQKSNVSDDIGPRVDPDEVEDDAHANEDGPHRLLDRCSTSVLLKANRLAALVVQQSRTLWRLPASLRSLLDSLILPSIQHGDPSVRNQAILALGLCCSMDLPLTLQYISLFYSAMRVDHAMISETALRCIIDCLLIFGFRPFHEAKIRPNRRITSSDDTSVVTDSINGDDDDEEDDENEIANDFVALIRQDGMNGTSGPCRREEMSKTVAHLIKPIVALLDSEDDDLQTSSALGLAKLLIYDRLMSSQVLSQLLLLWFNPITEDRPAIRRGLACFFTDYACGNPVHATVDSTSNSPRTGNYAHQAALANSVLPTLIALIRAPASSPLSEVEPADVAGLLARLTDATHWQKPQQQQAKIVTQRDEEHDVNENDNGGDPRDPAAGRPEGECQNPISKTVPEMDNPHHDQLALQLASEVLKAPQSAEAKLYLRMLCQLRPSRSNLMVHKELLLLSDAMFKFADRSTTLLLHRFRKLVNENLESLGFNPDQLLTELKRRATEAECSPRPSHSLSSKRENDSELYSTVRRPLDPNHPTLIGSARPNVHVLDGDARGPLLSPINPRGPGNRTLSVLDKSGRHMTLLNFSDDESDEDSKSAVNEVSVKATAVRPSEPQTRSPIIDKPSTKTKAIAASRSRVTVARRRSRVSARSSASDEDTLTKSDDPDEDEKENASTSRVPRRPPASKLSRQARRHSQPSGTSSQVHAANGRSLSKSTSRIQPAQNVRVTRSSLSNISSDRQGRSRRASTASTLESRTATKTTTGHSVGDRQR